MRKMSEVLEALSVRWEPPIKQVDGFDYIPWEATVSQMNRIFGPLGWSHGVVTLSLDEKEVDVWEPVLDEDGKPVYVGGKPKRTRVPRVFMGYSSVVPVEVQVFDDVHGTGVIKVSHAGVGFGPIIGQGNKNPLDNAAKSAKSDGISTAAKHYGDALGLFLYRKEETEESTQASGTPQRSSSGRGTNGFPVSAGRVTHLEKNGYTTEQIKAMNNNQASKFFDCLWKEHKSIEEAAQEAGIPLPAAPKEKKQAGDTYPIPR